MPRTNLGETLSAAAEAGGAVRHVKQAFAEYLAARTAFVNTVVGLSGKNCAATTLQALISSEALATLCCPLIQDPAAGIRATSLTALSQLLSQNSALADAVVQSGSLGPVMNALTDPEPPVQAAAAKVLGSVASACSSKDAQQENLQAMLNAGVADLLSQHLCSSSLNVLEAAVGTIRAMIAADPALASSFCTEATLKQLVVLLMAPGTTATTIKAILGTLSVYCSLGYEQATAAAQAGAIAAAARLVEACGQDAQLAMGCLTLLSNCASHSTDLGYAIINAGVLTHTLKALTNQEHPPLRAAAASLVLEVSRRSADTAALVLQQPGAAAALVQHLRLHEQQAEQPGKASSSGSSGSSSSSGSRLAAVLTIGHIASFSGNLASRLLQATAAEPLLACVDPTTSTTAACGSGSCRTGTDRTRTSSHQTASRVSSAVTAATGRGSAATAPPGALGSSCSSVSAGSIPTKGVQAAGSGLYSTTAGIAAGGGQGSSGGPSSSRQGGVDEVLAGAAAWALEQLGQHTTAAADQLAGNGALLALTTAYNRMAAHKDQQPRAKVKAAVKRLIRGTSSSAALLALLQPSTPPQLQRHVLQRLLPQLQAHPNARLECLTSGVLQGLPGLVTQAGTGTKLHRRLQGLVEAVLQLYPGDVQDYYSLSVRPVIPEEVA